MKNLTFKSKQHPPYDLLIIPVFVSLCFYVVVLQFNGSRTQLQLPSLDKNGSALVNIQIAEENQDTQLVMRRIPQAAMYPRVASMAFGMSIHDTIPLSNNRPTETYQNLHYNTINLASEKPVSTFSVDVDSCGFSNIRRILNSGRLPERNQIRIEEIINYFSYNYPKPSSKEHPFIITTGVTKSPWNKNSHLLQIGLKGFEEKVESLPNSNIVFLVDISGSMGSEKKLPLVKQALKLLTNNLRDNDRISLVTYAGNTHVVLSSTRGSDKALIRMAIDQLGAGGSTAGESGLRLAYLEAEQGFIKNGNNRIIMMTDGDFNVGMSGVDEMKRLVEEKRKSGVFLSTVGFGTGNYRDDMMEQMADHGNGIYFYIDNYAEAVRVFERNLRSNLFAIAKDVKIQVEFNSSQISEYRLVGYENRILNRADFNNDKVDAGDIGQGHSVTALYEITLVENKGKIDQNRYQSKEAKENTTTKELAFVKLRYKPIGSEESLLMTKPILSTRLTEGNLSVDFKTAILAASFGELLRDSNYISKEFDYSKLLKMINELGDEQSGDIYELRELVLLARSLD